MNPAPPPLDTRLAQLPTEVAPPRDLWPAIHARLDPPRQTRQTRRVASRPGWLPATALAAGVVLASLVLVRRDPPPTGLVDATMRAREAREAAFLEARAAVESDYERLMPQLAPETRQRVQQALDTIRRAETEIVAALAEDPSNPLLLRLRQRTARQQIDLMTTVTRDAVAELPRSET